MEEEEALVSFAQRERDSLLLEKETRQREREGGRVFMASQADGVWL
jgi:hypothetical protein